MAKQVKDFLSLLSDQTFLSTISFIDFENRYVQVKRKAWNIMFKKFNVRNPKAFSYVLKDLWILRFHDVSANQMKCFFSNTISASHIDFINVLRYYHEVIEDGTNNKIARKLNKKDIIKLRRNKHFEKKGFNYYLYINDIPKDDELDGSETSERQLNEDVHSESQSSHDEDVYDESQDQELHSTFPSNYVELIAQEFRAQNEFGDQITAPDQRDRLMESLSNIDFMEEEYPEYESAAHDDYTTITYEDIIHINEVETLNLGTVTRTYLGTTFFPDSEWD